MKRNTEFKKVNDLNGDASDLPVNTSIEESKRDRPSTPIMKECMKFADNEPLELLMHNRERRPAGTMKVMRSSKEKDDIMIPTDKGNEKGQESGFGPNPRKGINFSPNGKIDNKMALNQTPLETETDEIVSDRENIMIEPKKL